MHGDGRPRGVVDAHVHLWDPDRLSIGWLHDVPRLDRPVLPDEYARAAEGLGVRSAVIVEAAVDDSALDDEIRWIHEQIVADGLVTAGVAGWRPGGDPARTRTWLDRLGGVAGVVGVREVLHPGVHGASAPLEDGRPEAFADAGRQGLVVDLCVRPDQLPAIETVVRSVPDTTFVLDHLGRPRSAEPLDRDWRKAIERLAEHANVNVKISALIECADGGEWTPGGFSPFITAVLDAFGSTRAMWGSNWPVCVDTPETLASWFEAASFGIGDVDPGARDAILGDTARRVYGLRRD